MRFSQMPMSLHTTVAGLALIAGCLAIYFPGLHGPFVFDDYINIVDNADVAVRELNLAELSRAASSGVSSRFGRPLPYLSFGLNHYFAGGFHDSFPFKLTNVLIHGLNSLLVLWLATLLFTQLTHRTGRETGQTERLLPFLVALLWAVHPLQLTSVLYVVQRMTSLSAMFVLVGLILFVHGRRLLEARPRHGIALMTGGVVGGTVLGLACKENAILLLSYALVIELTLFSGSLLPWLALPARKRIYAVIAIAVFAAGLALWAAGGFGWIVAGYRLRDFSLIDRLLTEPRVLWFYVSLLFLPGTGRLTLFHDEFSPSAGWFIPWTTLPAILGLVGSLLGGIVLRRRFPVLAFAILWFLVGHSLESSVIALELVYEHRNYVPSLGPIVAIIYGLAALWRNRRGPIIATGLLMASTLSFTSFVLATKWRDETSLAEFMVENHPGSARSHEAMAGIYIRLRNDPLRAMAHYRTAAEHAPHETAYLLKLIHTASGIPPEQVRVEALHSLAPSRATTPEISHWLRVETHPGGKRYALDRDIHERISRQLATQPIMTGVQLTLQEQTECITQRPKLCGHLRDDTMSWLHIAIDNPRSPTKVKLQLLQLLTRLYLDSERPADALTQAERARAISPAHPAIVLMHADVLYRAGQPEAAEIALTRLTGPAPPGYEQEWQQADYLRSLLRQRQAP